MSPNHPFMPFSRNSIVSLKHKTKTRLTGTVEKDSLPLTMASIREDVLPNMTKAETHASILSTKKDNVIDDGGFPPSLRDLDPEELAILEKKLKRKIDWRMMPPLIVMYIMNYLDRWKPS